MNKRLKVVGVGFVQRGIFIAPFNLWDLFVVRAESKKVKDIENKIFEFMFKYRHRQIRKTVILEVVD